MPIKMSRNGKEVQEAGQRLTENNMFFLSWLTARGSGTASVCLITLTDSPADRDVGWIGQGRHQKHGLLFVLKTDLSGWTGPHAG